MTPIDFPQANKTYGPPPDLDESQCRSIRSYQGIVKGGSIDGLPIVVTAYQPSDEDRLRIANGAPIFISFIVDRLVPHMLTLDFESATHPR